MADIYAGVLPGDIEAMLRGVHLGTRSLEQTGDGVRLLLASRTGGRLEGVEIRLQDRLQNRRFGTLTLAVTLDSFLPLERINTWNRTRKYTRLFATQHGTLCLELDLSTEGLTRQLFVDSLRIFERSLDDLRTPHNGPNSPVGGGVHSNSN